MEFIFYMHFVQGGNFMAKEIAASILTKAKALGKLWCAIYVFTALFAAFQCYTIFRFAPIDAWKPVSVLIGALTMVNISILKDITKGEKDLIRLFIGFAIVDTVFWLIPIFM